MHKSVFSRILFSYRFYYEILSRAPCAAQSVLVVYNVDVNPKFISPSTSPFGNHPFVFYVCGSTSLLYMSSFALVLGGGRTST